MKYRCSVCGYVYDEEAEGTKFEDLPDDWTCPLCGVGKDQFEKVEEYMADVDSDEAFTPDTQVVADGYFHESEYRSAPYFDLDIDGITIK